ncbi:hypothetical protein B0T16DRAFT_418435 [Cercophora newfieldiana]|uniref:Uncharacterized protein n=1 Tax=Cercophora newfieldiana TaxID=92897 RepID=A0AA39XV31_9PEZI|nr:hypothetical protein B0T16DRAFT_418435 [Cercophora newfieldiana]
MPSSSATTTPNTMEARPHFDPSAMHYDDDAEWTSKLSGIDFGKAGASFFEVQCSANICFAAWLVTRLPGIVREGRGEGAKPPTLVYILPNQISIDVLEMDVQGFDAGLRVLTPAKLVKLLDDKRLDLRDSVVVLDTDRGRYPTNILTAATAVAQAWKDAADNKQPFNGTMISISQHSVNLLWSLTALKTHFNTGVVAIAFPRSAKVSSGINKLSVPDVASSRSLESGLARTVVELVYLEKYRKTALQKHTVVVVVLPERRIYETLDELKCSKAAARGVWADHEEQVVEDWVKGEQFFVLTPLTFSTQWKALQDTVKRLGDGKWLKVAVFVTPDMRFLPPIWNCELIYLTTRREVVRWQPGVGTFTREVRACPLVEGGWMSTLCQPHDRKRSHINVLYGDEELQKGLDSPLEGREEFLAETLLTHVDLFEDRLASPRLVKWPDDRYACMELLRRLHQLRLISVNPKIWTDLRTCSTGWRITVDWLGKRIPRGVTHTLLSGEARSVPEVLLLGAAMERSCVQQFLLGFIALRRVGVSNVFRPATGVPTFQDCLPYRWHGAGLENRGQIMLALSMFAKVSDEGGTEALGNINVSAIGYEALTIEYERLCGDVCADFDNIHSIPLDEPARHDIEVAIVTAWVHNLVVLPLSTEAEQLTEFQDITTSVTFRHSGGWGMDLRPRPGIGFAIHFGLRVLPNRELVADEMMLVSNKAVRQVLREMFPDEENGNYAPLLATQYPAAYT